MPQYDYDEFGRRRAEAQKEWEARKTMEGGEGGSYESSTDHGDVDKW